MAEHPIGMVSRSITPEEEAKGAYWVAVTKDAVFPTINEKNPVLQDLLGKGVTQEVLEGIYITGEITTWGQVVGKPEVTDEIHVYTRSDAAGAPEVWAKYLGDKKQEDLLGVGVFGDPGLLDAVAKDPLGIGFNNLGYAYDAASGKPVAGTLTLPIDGNGNGAADSDELLETKAEAIEMVATGKYPSPPARPLNLVTNGKPEGKLVRAFIEWIVTDTPALPNLEAYSTPGAGPWGTDYIWVTGDPKKVAKLTFNGLDYSMFPTGWTSDGNVLWGGKSDLLDSWAIFETVGGGTLTFDTAYDIEPYWDFGFVQVSTDGGYTWKSLANAYTTSDYDPNAHPKVIANLPGLTGTHTWMNISYDLGAYAGQDILVAFRYVTDWGTTGAAFCCLSL